MDSQIMYLKWTVDCYSESKLVFVAACLSVHMAIS